MIDEIDSSILTILQENARTSNAEIARQVGLVPSAIGERVKKLEERGVIRGYGLELDARKLGLGLMAFIFVGSEEAVGSECTGEALARIPEVQEVHHTAGEDCYLIKVRVAGTEELRDLLRYKLGAIETIRSTRSVITLATIKETAKLPLENSPEEAPEETMTVLKGGRP